MSKLTEDGNYKYCGNCDNTLSLSSPEKHCSDCLAEVGVQTTEEKNNKPTCKLIGEDGNPFSIIGRVSKVLRRAGLDEELAKFNEKAFEADSYDDLLNVVQDFVEVE